jgi:Cof subfamily protein (haloacid dehalogenase superfamily)
MRLVATDIDGTILPHQGEISERTLGALASCRDRGIEVVLVTGRPYRWLAPVTGLMGRRGIVVCANGAVVYDLADDTVLECSALTSDQVLRAVERMRTALPGAAFALETLDGFRREPEYLPHATVDVHSLAVLQGVVEPPERVGALPELLADGVPVVKLLCRADGAGSRGMVLPDPDAMLDVVRPLLAGLVEVVHSSVKDPLVEIAALGVDKATALAGVAASRGIGAADVVAFGDMPNDVPMLLWAGKGYAVADGHPEALAAADEIAPACPQEGVARVLEMLLADGDGGDSEVLAG